MPTLNELNKLLNKKKNSANNSKTELVDPTKAEKPEGLQSLSRANEEKAKIESIKLEKPIEAQYSDKYYVPFDKNDISAFDLAKEKYERVYRVGTEAPLSKPVKDIKNIALQNSPWYKKFQNSEDHITFNDEDWLNLAVQYNALKDAKGENDANYWLNGQIQNEVSHNQSTAEKYWNGFKGMGASAAGSTIALAGALIELTKYPFKDYEEIEGLGGFDQFFYNIMNNPISKYGSDVMQYGSLSNETLEKAKEIGISELPIVGTREEELGMESMFNENTLPNIIAQEGFTLASLLSGWSFGKLSNWAFGASKRAIVGKAAAKSANDLMKTRTIIKGLTKAQNIVNVALIPGIVGSGEGLINGLQTQETTMEKGKNIIEYNINEAIKNKIREQVSNNPNLSEEDYYNLVDKTVKNFEPIKKEAMEQLKFVSAQAGVNDFYINSFINGLINTTLQAGMMYPSVNRSIKNSKMLGWLNSDVKLNVTKTGGKYAVKPSMNTFKKIKALTKEPVGEFTEEYVQTISSNVQQDVAANNLEEFLKHKYDGDSSTEVGEWFSSDYSTAFSSLTKNLVDKEAVKSGIYGALTSAIGLPKISRPHMVINKQGKVTHYGRGVNTEGKKESTLDYLLRVTPWRSGIGSSYREMREDIADAKESAKSLEEWLNDPTNRNKFDGVIGTAAWAHSMEESAKSNDEFSYRNSLLGKTINDAIMLEKLRGTDYYDSVLSQLYSSANMEEGSKEANDYINLMKSNSNTDIEGMSDTDILNQGKKRANDMLTLLDDIHKESDSIESLLGNVNDDVKQSLIYGQLTLKDLSKRKDQLTKEVNDINSKIESSVDNIDITDEQKKLILKYGSAENIAKRSYQLSGLINAVEKDIKNLEKRKNNLSKKEKEILKEKKSKLKEYNKEQDTIYDKETKTLKVTNKFDKDKLPIFSEQDIMNLPVVERAKLFIKGKSKLYSKRIKKGNSEKGIQDEYETREYFTKDQQAVIDNLMDQGMAIDKGFIDKVIDLGRIESSSKNLLKEYNAALSDPNILNIYAQRAKRDKARVLAEQKFNSLADIKNYEEFANQMDSLSEDDLFAVSDVFKDYPNDNFNKYIKSKEILKEFLDKLNTSERFQEIDDNSKSMLVYAISYLENKDVNLYNIDNVIDELSSRDDEGTLKFIKYFNSASQNVDSGFKPEFTSLGDIISDYKRVIDVCIEDEEAKANNKKPVKVESNSGQAATPSPVIVPENKKDKEEDEETPNIFEDGTATDSVNEGDGYTEVEIEGQEKKPQIKDKPEEKKANKPFSRPNKENVVNDFRTNSGEKVASIAESIISHLESLSKSTNKEKTLDFINSLKTTRFKDVDDFINQVTNEALSNEDISDILLEAIDVAEKSITPSEEQKFTQETPQQSINNGKNPNAGVIESADIQELADSNPNSPILVYLNSHNTDKFLKSNKVKIGRDRDRVYFITDKNLTDSMQEEDPNAETPIIAIVKSEDGDITIDGINYQVVGILPNSNSNNSGRVNAQKIRELANGTASHTLIKDANGNTLEGSLNAVVARSPEYTRSSVPDSGVRTLAMRKLSEASKKVLLVLDTVSVKASNAWKEMRSTFLKEVYSNTDTDIDRMIKDGVLKPNNDSWKTTTEVEDGDNSDTKLIKELRKNYKNNRPAIFKIVSNLKGGHIPLYINSRPISETKNEKGDKLIVDMLLNDDKDQREEFLNANNAIRAAVRSLAQFINSGLLVNATIERDADGKIIIDQRSLDDSSINLQRSLGNYIYLASGYVYNIKATGELIDGNPEVVISVIDTTNRQEFELLKTAKNAKLSNEELVAFFKNLIIDPETNKVRIANNKFNSEVVKWQIPYPHNKKDDASKALDSTEEYGKAYSSLFDDDIMAISYNDIEYTVTGIKIDSPRFTDKKVDAPVTTEVSNPSNATSAGSINTPVIEADAVSVVGGQVSSTSGTVIEGKVSKPKSNVVKNTKDIVDKIILDSKQLKLNDDDSGYTNTKTNIALARVTSIIQADETSTGRFSEYLTDPDGEIIKDEDGNPIPNPWILPSTSIGNTFDRFVRDFFSKDVYIIKEVDISTNKFKWVYKKGKDGETKSLSEVYSNASQKQLEAFAESLAIFKNQLTSEGKTIISEGITVSGKVNITGKDGKTYPISIAGTLDLFAYDSNGNFYIYDMKTHREEISISKMDKYARQLSLYKKLLEEKYGINVKELLVIPIEVDYPVPSGVRGMNKVSMETVKGTAEYSVLDNDQLQIGNKLFKDANPKLGRVRQVNYAEPKIVYSNLTKDEQQIIEGMIERPNTDNNIPVSPITPTPDVSQEDLINLGTNVGIEGISLSLDTNFTIEGFEKSSNETNTTENQVDNKYKWGKLEGATSNGKPINIEKTMKNLKSQGWKEESWNNTGDQARQHALDCFGVAK